MGEGSYLRGLIGSILLPHVDSEFSSEAFITSNARLYLMVCSLCNVWPAISPNCFVLTLNLLHSAQFKQLVGSGLKKAEQVRDRGEYLCVSASRRKVGDRNLITSMRRIYDSLCFFVFFLFAGMEMTGTVIVSYFITRRATTTRV